MTRTRAPIRRAEIEIRRGGFSIIELLVVMSIIALLGSIAIPRFTGATERSFEATVKSDVRNALSAQEIYYLDNGSYAAFDLEPGGSVDEPDFSASAGVSVTATTDGSTVRIIGSHQSSDTTWCMSSNSGAVVEGEEC